MINYINHEPAHNRMIERLENLERVEVGKDVCDNGVEYFSGAYDHKIPGSKQNFSIIMSSTSKKGLLEEINKSIDHLNTIDFKIFED